MIITEQAEYIQSQGFGTFLPDSDGGDIFIEEMPDKPDDAICLYTTGGMGADVATSIKRPGTQIILRGVGLRALQTRAQAIHDLFDGKHNTSFGDSGETHIMLCRCLHTEPVNLGRDANKRHQYNIETMLITGGQ